MALQITQEEHDRERALFEAERKRVPELFDRAPMVDDAEVLRSVGIEGADPARPVAYLKLMPQDFVVEEIARDGSVCSASDEAPAPGTAPLAGAEGEGMTWYADLVKVGISTLEAKSQIAHALGIDEKGIGYAGIKDRVALTSQAMSMRGVNDPAALGALKADNFFLRNLRRGKGVVANGDLSGNRFTIALRLTEPLGTAAKAALEKRIDEIREDGFWNFFYLQRFGTPRLISHELGRLLSRGEYEEVVKKFLTHIAQRELPYFAAIRREIAGKWGDWAAIWEMIDRFPYHFHIERAFVRHLKDNPTDFHGALNQAQDQVRLWIYAYDSFAFNKKLSELIRTGEVPLSLPLLTSFNPADWKPYAAELEADGVRLPSRAWKDFPFVRIESRRTATIQKIDIHDVSLDGRVAAMSFSLPKGSYATSFLMEFFALASGLPAVPGISQEAVDVKEMLGEGSLAPALVRFKKVLDERRADIGAAQEE